MCYSARQLPHRLHLLRLPELFLGRGEAFLFAEAVSHIPAEQNRRRFDDPGHRTGDGTAFRMRCALARPFAPPTFRERFAGQSPTPDMTGGFALLREMSQYFEQGVSILRADAVDAL